MRRRAAVLTFALLLAGSVLPAPAEVPQVTVELAPTPEDAPAWHVGTPVPLQVVVNLPPGYQAVTDPQPREGQEELVLRRSGNPSGEARPGGGSIRQHTMELVPLQLGELTFAGLSVPWTSGSGESGEAVSAPLTLTVVAVIADPLTAEPADIRGPASLPVPVRYGLLALLILALALAAGLAWWWFRPRLPEEAAAVVPVVDPFAGLGPAQWALDALDRLVQQDVLGRKGTAHYHVSLADIVRRYLGGQFHIPTLERTTNELLRDAEARLRPLPGTRERLRHVLGSCDLVKFARLQPVAEESLALARAASELVEETRPRPQPQVAPAPEAG